MQIVLHSQSEFDPFCVDAFFIRVVQARDVLKITLRVDVTDEAGTVIFPQDLPLNEFVVRRFQQRKIQQNLMSIFVASNALTWKELVADFSLALREDEFLSRLQEHLDLNEILLPVIHQFDPEVVYQPAQMIEHDVESQKLPELAKKPFICDEHFFLCLSLLKVTCPETYRRTILCSWLSLLIAKEMRLDAKETRILFTASLCHDLGMLHVPSEILSSDESLSPEDWLEIQKHVFASAYLAQASFVDDAVATAISEHHERCDGTGYPSGKVESELSMAGKILGLSDSVIAIFRNRFDHNRHSWREAIPIVQMNAQAYFFRHSEILTNLWRRAEMPSRRVISSDELKAFVIRLRSDYRIAQDWFNALTQGFIGIGFTHGDRKLHAMQNVALHLATSARGLGIFTDEFTRWLNEVDQTSFDQDAKKIQDAHINLQEIILHLQKLTRMLKLFLDEEHCEHKKIQQKLNELMAKIKEILVKKD